MRLRRPNEPASGSAIHTASHEPVASQRTSNSGAAPSAITAGVVWVRSGPALARNGRRTSDPAAGTTVFDCVPAWTVPSHATSQRPVGSTTGRQSPPAIAVSVPVIGSMKNDFAATALVTGPVVSGLLPRIRAPTQEAKTLM